MTQKRDAQPDHKTDKVAIIFEAACRVFRKKGFHQARMTDIAMEAGISYGLIYHYFRSKSCLFDALIAAWWDDLDRILDDLLNQTGLAAARLQVVAEFFLDQYASRPDLVHLFIREYSRSMTNLTPERMTRLKAFLKRIDQIVRAGQAGGELRPDMQSIHLTFFFLGALETLLSSMVLENREMTNQEGPSRLARVVLTMFLEGGRA